MDAEGMIREVRNLSPRAGDVVYVKLAETASAEVVESLCARLRDILPAGVRAIVADVGIEDVDVIRMAVAE